MNRVPRWKIVTVAVLVVVLTGGVVTVLLWAGTRGLTGQQLITARFDALKIGLSIGVGSGGLYALDRLLLSAPHPPKVPVKLWRDHPPLDVVHFPPEFRTGPYAPPRGVYENDEIRVEWQTLHGRQPFYHRNCDVDEISYQVTGERPLMSELGVIEFQPGDLSRIPRGVAHDNHCHEDIRLLFLPVVRSK